jgi:hypothetical protein
VSEATGVRDVAVDLVVSFCTIDRAYGFLKGTLPAIRDARCRRRSSGYDPDSGARTSKTVDPPANQATEAS